MTNKNIEFLTINGLTLGLSFTNIENVMKLFLLTLSIIYTIIQIYNLLTKKNDK